MSEIVGPHGLSTWFGHMVPFQPALGFRTGSCPSRPTPRGPYHHQPHHPTVGDTLVVPLWHPGGTLGALWWYLGGTLVWKAKYHSPPMPCNRLLGAWGGCKEGWRPHKRPTRAPNHLTSPTWDTWAWVTPGKASHWPWKPTRGLGLMVQYYTLKINGFLGGGAPGQGGKGRDSVNPWATWT